MASHNLDHQPQNQLVTKIAELEDQISQMRTLQLQGTSAVNMQPTGVYSTTGTSIGTNTAVIFRYTLSSTTNKMIFAHFYFTLYEDSAASTANIIGENNLLQFGYRVYHRADWASIDLPAHGYNQTEYVWVENQTGSTHDIIMRGEWRYIVNGGSVAVS